MTDTNLLFIREKITAVRTAIMYSLCDDDLINLPNSLVNALEVDEDGHLWLLCERPPLSAERYPQSFPVRLSFYRKGAFFRLEVSGRAEIVRNDDKAGEQHLLICMKITNVEYTDMSGRKKSAWEASLEKGYRWMLRNIGFTRTDKPVLSRLHSADHS